MNLAMLPVPSEQVVGRAMAEQPRFRGAFAYQKDVLALPVKDLDAASQWYREHFGMTEVERFMNPCSSVTLG
jgi:hypothetical protein